MAFQVTFDGTTGKIGKEFSQASVINVLEKDMTKGYDIIKNGFCYALSMYWLYQVVEHPDRIPEFPMTLANSSTMALYKQVANNYIPYAESFKLKKDPDPSKLLTGIDVFDKTDVATDNRYLNLWTKDRNLYGGCQIVEKPEFFRETTTHFNHWISLYTLRWATGGNVVGHAMALANIDKKLYFFDPNYGTYEVNDAAKLYSDLIKKYAGDGCRDYFCHLSFWGKDPSIII